MAARCQRPQPPPSGSCHPSAVVNAQTWAAHGGCGQAVHPLGQNRHRHTDGPLRTARFHGRHRHGVPRRDWSEGGRAGWQRERGRGVGAAVHAEPHAAHRPALDGTPARSRRSRIRPGPVPPASARSVRDSMGTHRQGLLNPNLKILLMTMSLLEESLEI